MSVEQMRRDSPFQQNVLEIYMSDISVWYAFIQMFLTSTAEILDNPDNYHFASDVAPNQLMSVLQPFTLVSGRTISNCITGPRPTEIALRAVIVKCSEEAPVVSAINFVNRCGYKVTVRICVHSYTGSSSCNFESCLQLDLTAMNATSVEDK